MSLYIYTKPNNDSKVSSTNPIRFTTNGIVGGIIIKKVYIRNNDDRYYYSSITVDISGDDVYINNVWTWKLAQKDYPPTTRYWDSISHLNTISISDVGTSSTADTATYIPIYIYARIPDGVPAGKKEISLNISATQGVVNG